MRVLDTRIHEAFCDVAQRVSSDSDAGGFPK
jgi:hypothetical protein